ncbi:hypothetical protein CEXT_749391 [Caerostris extrusa]|uniref:Ribosomal protein L27 n=1 Tax=Caerostris extrusa TaxID=172846 RepID=A0AAV4QBH9_CAEEX|nr:hypothetical protein CEXT_749391 [Caerostris extrusa]
MSMNQRSWNMCESSPGPSNQRRQLLGDACAPQRGNYREGRPHVFGTRGSIVLKKQPGRYVTAVAKGDRRFFESVTNSL